MNNDAILLVGASVRWAATSAAAAGHRVFGMDLFGDCDTLSHCAGFRRIRGEEYSNREKFQQAVRDFAAAQQATVVRVGGLASLTIPAIEPPELARLATESGFQVPDSFDDSVSPVSGSDGENLKPRLLTKSAEGIRVNHVRWLLKQSGSTGGLGVRFAEPRSHARSDKTSSLQRWIPGRAFGLVALARAEGVSLLGMTRSMFARHGDRPFVYAGSRSVPREEPIPWDAMQTLAETIAEHRQLRGLFNLDWIRDRSGRWWLLEVNERPSASCEVIERTARDAGVLDPSESLMAMHINAASLSCEPNGFPIRSNAVYVKRIVDARHGGHVDLSTLPSEWQEQPDNHSLHPGRIRIHVADRPATGTPIQTGQPIATILLDSTTNLNTTARAVRDAVRRVQSTVIVSEPIA